MSFISITRRMMAAIALLAIAVGCAGGPGAADPAEKAGAPRSYPYTLSNGALVCGEQSAGGPLGELQKTIEWYPTATMNRLLESVGTPDAAAPVDAAFKLALHARGVDRIETCEDARAYQEVKAERRRAESEAAPAPAAADSVEPSPDSGDTFEDKIINGVSRDYAYAAAIMIDPENTQSLCTGQLIGPFAMLTAGHCVPPTLHGAGFVEIASWVGLTFPSATCISPGGCPSGAAQAYVAVHPNFDAPGDGNDQAVVIAPSPGWQAPANASGRWTAFAANIAAAQTFFSQRIPLEIAGYGKTGASGDMGGGSNVGRGSQLISSISTIKQTFAFMRTTGGASATCVGDSGSGANQFLNVSGRAVPFSIGIFSSFGQLGVTVCTSVGEEMVYAVPDGPWISSIVNFFGGNCRTTSVGPFSFVKCF